MRTTRDVLTRYDAAGGALLAGGLAYSALFAIVPLTLLTAGILGLFVADPDTRADVVGAIANVLPPLRELIQLILEEAAGAAGAISIIGGAFLIWGASRFVVSFEETMARIFGGERRRGLVARNAVGIGAVIGLIGAAFIGTVLTGLASFLDAAEDAGGPVAGLLVDFILVAAPTALVVLALGLVYRYVPVVGPRWRSIAVPAIVVGIVLTVLTRAFVFLAPRLIGAAATIGVLATAFAALAWLALSFQAILLGAAWVRQRDPTWGTVSAALDDGAGPGTTAGAGQAGSRPVG